MKGLAKKYKENQTVLCFCFYKKMCLLEGA